MELTYPLRLAALAAIAIPVLLHLWQRRPAKVVRVGSIRHLPETPAARRLSSRFSERWLLLLRLSVVVTLAAALAGPFISDRSPGSALALIDPAIPDGSVERIVDSLAGSGDVIIRPEGGDIWSLIREVGSTVRPGSRLAVVTSVASPLIGTRPAVGPLATLRLVDVPDSMRLPDRVEPPSLHRVDIIATAAQATAARYLAAAVRAVASVRGDSIQIVVTSLAGQNGGSGSAELIFLTDADDLEPILLGRVRAGATAVVFGAGPDEDRPDQVVLAASAVPLLVQRVGEGRIARVATEESIDRLGLSEDLPELVSAIWPAPEVSQKVDKLARVRNSEQQILPRTGDDGPSRRSVMQLAPLLLAFGALLFVLERFASHRQPPAR